MSGFACTGGQRVQCSTDGNGCPTSGTPMSCPTPQTCQGALPAATCACPTGYNPPECDAAGEVSGSRCVGSTLTTCTNAGAGCQQLTTMTCPANQLCVGSHPNARCAGEQTHGWPAAAGGQESWSGLLVGVRINVPVAASLRRVGLVWNGNGGTPPSALSRTATFALFRDVGTGAGPTGSAIASSIDRPLSQVGAADFNLTNPAGGLTLTAGDYWLFVNLNMAGYVARNTSPSTPYLYMTHSYGSQLPMNVQPSSFQASSLAGPLGFYMVVIPQQ